MQFQQRRSGLYKIPIQHILTEPFEIKYTFSSVACGCHVYICPELDTGILRNHRRTRRCLVKNAVPTTKNWPLQIIFLAFPDITIYNKKPFSSVWFTWVLWLSCFLLCGIGYWCEWVFFEKKFMHQSLRCISTSTKLPKNCSFVGFW